MLFVPEIWCNFNFGLSNLKCLDWSLKFQKGNNLVPPSIFLFI